MSFNSPLGFLPTDNINNAIQLFKSALALDLKGDLAAPAAYSIGYYYDQTAVIDSAVKYYQWIKENHPGSDQSKQADIRLQTLNMVLSSITPPDTLESSVQEDNWEQVFFQSVIVLPGI